MISCSPVSSMTIKESTIGKILNMSYSERKREREGGGGGGGVRVSEREREWKRKQYHSLASQVKG